MAKERKLLLLAQAAEDLDQIYDPLLSRIVYRLRLLRKFPHMGKPLTGRFARWRCTPVGLFKIIYRLTPRGVEVGYIRHCKRADPRQ